MPAAKSFENTASGFEISARIMNEYKPPTVEAKINRQTTTFFLANFAVACSRKNVIKKLITNKISM